MSVSKADYESISEIISLTRGIECCSVKVQEQLVKLQASLEALGSLWTQDDLDFRELCLLTVSQRQVKEISRRCRAEFDQESSFTVHNIMQPAWPDHEGDPKKLMILQAVLAHPESVEFASGLEESNRKTIQIQAEAFKRQHEIESMIGTYHSYAAHQQIEGESA